MTTQLKGVLEIDHERGVIYFHTSSPRTAAQYGSVTVLRICRLPAPIPRGQALDITHMHGCDWLAGPAVPPCGPTPRFKVGDRVHVVRLITPFDGAELLDFWGRVEEVETVSPTQHNYVVDGRYLNEQMLAPMDEETHRRGCGFYAAQRDGLQRPSGACTCGLTDRLNSEEDDAVLRGVRNWLLDKQP